MQMSKIKCFLAIVTCGTFSEAAEMLYTTQSTVSKQILALEAELSVTLFDRTTRRVKVTPAGDVFLEYARKMLELNNHMKNALSDLQIQSQSIFRIGSIPVMVQYNLTTLIAEFRRKHTHVCMEVDEQEADDLLTALDNGDYEMIFYRIDQCNAQKYQIMKLCEDKLVLVVSQAHPLAQKSEISLADLSHEAFLFLDRRTSLYGYCIKACQQAGFTPQIVYTGTRIENIVSMVGQAMGIALLMEQTARFVLHDNTHVVLVPLKEDLRTYISLIRLRKKKPSAIGQEFWDFVRANCVNRTHRDSTAINES